MRPTPAVFSAADDRSEPYGQGWTRATLGAAAVYITAVLIANATAETFIPLPFFGLVSVGTLFFGLTFTQRDRVHRAGKRQVYTMLGVTAVLATLESLLLDVPWRIILASCLAILLAEAADTEVYHRLRRHGWYARVAGSNAVSIPLDSLIFTVTAFAGVFSAAMIVEIVWGDIVAKGAVGMLAALWRG
ncbi:MAG: VUT family protein, partial [Chloroflexia bacterium]|nr:VUT family protein [Chloroflexia bacterium]